MVSNRSSETPFLAFAGGLGPAPLQRGAPSVSGFCGIGAPARAQPVQSASLEVVIQSSSSIGRPQYVSLIWGLATCTLPSPLAWRTFISSLCDLRASVVSLVLLFRCLYAKSNLSWNNKPAAGEVCIKRQRTTKPPATETANLGYRRGKATPIREAVDHSRSTSSGTTVKNSACQVLTQPFVELLHALHRGGGALLDYPHVPHDEAHALPEGVVGEHRKLALVISGTWRCPSR